MKSPEEKTAEEIPGDISADRYFDDDEEGIPGLFSQKEIKGADGKSSFREKYHPSCLDMAVSELPFRVSLSCLTLEAGSRVGFANIKCKDIEGMEVRLPFILIS